MSWYIYGLREAGASKYRYVGLTTKTPEERLRKHLKEVRKGSTLHCHNWIRSVGSRVEVRVLEECPQDLEYLKYSEKYWIMSLKEIGHDLTNMTGGGDGQMGVKLSAAHRNKISESLKNGKAPWTGKTLSESHRTNLSLSHLGYKASEETKRKLSEMRSGAGGSMYGRFGEDHPAFGRTHTEEAIAKMKIHGLRNSRKASHVRWHVNRGVSNPDCQHCTN